MSNYFDEIAEDNVYEIMDCSSNVRKIKILKKISTAADCIRTQYRFIFMDNDRQGNLYIDTAEDGYKTYFINYHVDRDDIICFLDSIKYICDLHDDAPIKTTPNNTWYKPILNIFSL